MVADDFCDHIDLDDFPSCLSDADSTVNRKDEICLIKDSFEFGGIVGDIDFLCSSTDADGTGPTSPTDYVCEWWPDVCDFVIPSVASMCEEPWNAPEEIHAMFEGENGDSIYSFCDD
jgi:hypothetical protein